MDYASGSQYGSNESETIENPTSHRQQIVTEFRKGYEPERDKGLPYYTAPNGIRKVYVPGTQLPYRTTTAGWFIDGKGWEVLLAMNDGNCLHYDFIHHQEKRIYRRHKNIPGSFWNSCWVSEFGATDGEHMTQLIIATNGMNGRGAICTWDLDTGERGQCIVLHDKPFKGYLLAPAYHCFTYSGPLLLYSRDSNSEVSIYDIRDGERIFRWNLDLPITGMQYSRPVNWIQKEKVAIAEQRRLAIWDVQAQGSVPLMSFRTFGANVDAVHTNFDESHHQQHYSDQRPEPDGVYCANKRICIIDMRCRSCIEIKIPLHLQRITTVGSFGDTILVGCSTFENSGHHGTMERVLEISLKKGTIMTSYTIPSCTNMGLNTAIGQVWTDGKYVVALNEGGLYVYEQFDTTPEPVFGWERPHSNRIRSHIGPGNLRKPSFHTKNDTVIITSTNNPPYISGY